MDEDGGCSLSMVLSFLRFLSVCVFVLGVGAQLLCVIVIFFKCISNFVNFSGVSGFLVSRFSGVGGG